MVTPESGVVYFKNKDISKIDPVKLRRSAAMLPQSPVIFDGSVNYNAVIGAVFSEKPAPDEESVNGALRIAGLNKNPGEPAGNLSGGEQQRLSLARIILQNPDIFLLDEPTSSLDRKTELTVMGRVMEHLRMKRKTAVIVSHSYGIAEEFADIIYSLKNGGLSLAEKGTWDR